MGCNCGTRRDEEAAQQAFEALDAVGLREASEHSDGAMRIATDAIRSLNKSDRAAVLGLGDDVVSPYREEAERLNRLARQQFSAVIETIDARVGRDDWPGLVEQVRSAFEERDGARLLNDMKAQVRVGLLDADALTPAVTEEVVGLLDRTVEVGHNEGLEGSVRLVREQLQRAVDELGPRRWAGNPDRR